MMWCWALGRLAVTGGEADVHWAAADWPSAMLHAHALLALHCLCEIQHLCRPLARLPCCC